MKRPFGLLAVAELVHLNCTCELVHTHHVHETLVSTCWPHCLMVWSWRGVPCKLVHMHETLVWAFWTHCWDLLGVAAFTCTRELVHTSRMHVTLVWRLWTYCLVLLSSARPNVDVSQSPCITFPHLRPWRHPRVHES